MDVGVGMCMVETVKAAILPKRPRTDTYLGNCPRLWVQIMCLLSFFHLGVDEDLCPVRMFVVPASQGRGHWMQALRPALPMSHLLTVTGPHGCLVLRLHGNKTAFHV